LDLDKDGSLSAAEIEAAPQSLLKLDKNADGTISRKELNRGKPPVKA
jgi:Ca2+-binding EF-hand superfamily protein